MSDWDKYFMSIAEQVSTRSKCLRRKVGAILVRDRRILVTGYNGPPSGMFHCDKVGCIRKQLDIKSGARLDMCRAIHAEQNCIVQAATQGINVSQSTLYCTAFPCFTCAKLLVQAKIERVCFLNDYEDKMSRDLLVEANVPFMRILT
jgi:dCMP deaminase